MDRETLRKLMGPHPGSARNPVPLLDAGAESVDLCWCEVYTSEGAVCQVAYLQTGYAAYDYVILDWRLS